MTDITIRAACAEDSAEIAELLTELGYPTEQSDIPGRLVALASDDRALLVAVRAGRAVALMGLERRRVIQRARPVAHITLLVTAAAHRGRGIGRQLVAAAESWARAGGCERISLTSGEQRTRAHAFYERCGLPYNGRRFGKMLD